MADEVRLTVRLSADLAGRVAAAARSEDRSQGYVIRRALESVLGTDGVRRMSASTTTRSGGVSSDAGQVDAEGPGSTPGRATAGQAPSPGPARASNGSCPECGRFNGVHKRDCSRHPGVR
jgi:predicted transcriptional regulator